MMSQVRGMRLRMIAGPNGSGKSSIIRNLAREWSANGLFWLNHYLNADDVERALISSGLDLERFNIDTSLDELRRALRSGGRLADDDPFFREGRLDGSLLSARHGSGYIAAAMVDFLRERLVQRGDSFSFETVMSHPSKIEFFRRAHNSGYKTYLYFVCTSSPELNVARVRARVATGGHAVPEDKIRERYGRSLALVRDALAHTYRAYFFDNSGREPVWLAEFDPQGNCQLKVPHDNLPRWFRTVIGGD